LTSYSIHPALSNITVSGTPKYFTTLFLTKDLFPLSGPRIIIVSEVRRMSKQMNSQNGSRLQVVLLFLTIQAFQNNLLQVKAFQFPMMIQGRHSLRVSSLRLNPDGFLEGSSFDKYDPSGRRTNMGNKEIIHQDIRAGSLAPFEQEEEGGYVSEGGQPMVRLDGNVNQSQDPTARSTIQGAGSRAQWAAPDVHGYDEMNVQLGTEGRPLHANVEHWSSPGYTASKMALYSEDGGTRPWMTKFRRPEGSSPGVMEVKNVGPMEFPAQASVTGSSSGNLGAAASTTNYDTMESTGGPPVSPNLGNRMTRPLSVEGDALKYFHFDPSVNHVYLEISSEGRPVYAKVELWQGPGNIKQIADIYTDDGAGRRWSAVIPMPGVGSTICVANDGPIEYPFLVSMDPPPTSID
jgi:hypothetical protein